MTRLKPVFKEIILPTQAEGAQRSTRPLDVLRSLQSQSSFSKSGFSQAFLFRRADSVDGVFQPSQTLLAFDPLENVQVRDEDPFQKLSNCLGSYSLEALEGAIEGLPAFQGGALGYISYDSVRHLEKVLERMDGNLSKAYSASGGERPFDGEFAIYRKYVIFDHLKNRVCFLVLVPETSSMAEGRAADSELLDMVQCYEETHRKERHLKQSLAKSSPAPLSPTPEPVLDSTLASTLASTTMSSMQGEPQFLSRVRELQEHIKKGDIFQAVISERFETPFSGNAIDLFETLSELSPSPYQFLFLNGERSFLGASPEMLLRVQGEELETHPIAGTRPRGANAQEEMDMMDQLLADPKEKAEHLMLVDLARNDLGRVSKTGSVRVESFQKIEKFGGVMHLVSKVKGSLASGRNAVQALASCFPAGTLSGAPKIRAMQLLSQMEPRRRGFYGGAVIVAGFNGDLDSCISIRSIEISGGVARIQAGAGIVLDSVPEREYEEVLHKTRIVRQALSRTMAQVRTQESR